MANLNYTDQQIDDFIMGLLDEKEIQLFNEALASDQDLGLRVKARQTLIKGVEEYHSIALKNKLKKIHEKAFDAKTAPVAKKRNLMPWLAAAAGIALLVLALMWLNQPAPNSGDLFASNFKAHELSLAQRDAGNKDLVRLEQLYNDKDYKRALPIFESMINEGDQTIDLQLGAGISKLALGQIQDALNHFQSIISSGDLLFKDHAVWYMALAYLKLDDLTQAKSFLQQLSNDKGADHHEEAISLLKDME